MLPGIGGSEIVVIAVIALLVVGPKDLPKLLRQIGRFVGKMRGMADDFRSSFEDMARQSELDDLRKEVEALRTNRVPVLDDVRTEIEKVQYDVNESLTPTTHFYSGSEDVASPDADDFNTSEPEVPVSVPVEEMPAVSLDKPAPKKTRAKAPPQAAAVAPVKVAAKPRATKTAASDAAAPKRTRKSKAS
ncbi:MULTISPECIES: Sec-independent protein translocase protein TatB [Asticcacaulis]|uniref:Sec-independent protein translocase protein TatB n=1 Tax=Asticcacaulis TaxID=76890 RepID=UPI001AE48CDE|nr:MULTISPECIES: Sec-independent protein translocase protein TatB [Asticcacaulis]MBP2158542.1 sec-independent protein translocase protein TatB [Asticcacaulis solisilvae]MDR6799588.1 sec-independent protein translocase protein TatB [Asticcacaulis sp. BE141]